MKKYLFLSALLAVFCRLAAQERIIAENVLIGQGAEAALVVGMNFAADHDYVSYQFTVELPDGITLKADRFGKADYALASNQPSEVFTVDFLVSNGIFKAYSSPSYVIEAHEGTLVTIPIVADESLAVGTVLNGKLTGIVFSHADAQAENFQDVSFTIEVVENVIVLDEMSTTVPEAAENVNVLVKRTIKANEWSTICLPFAMSAAQCKTAFGEDVQLGDFTGCDVDDETGNVKVKFNDVTAIEANHPYIIKVSQAISEFTVDGVDINPADEPAIDMDPKKISRTLTVYNSFVGNYTNGTVLDDGLLFLYDNKLCFSNGKTKMKAFRGFFDFTAADAFYESRLSIVFDDKTGIDDTQRLMDSEKGTKKMYNLSGQRVKKAAKGLYIQNGRKVVIN